MDNNNFTYLFIPCVRSQSKSHLSLGIIGHTYLGDIVGCDKFEYQTEGKIDYMPSFASDLLTFSKIQARLKKHFPKISVKGLEKILKEFNN